MKINLSGNVPQLVTMEGERIDKKLSLMGIDAADKKVLSKGYLTPAEKHYFSKKHPELMGFLPLLLAALPAVLTGVSAVVTATKSPQNNEASNQAALQAAVQAQAERDAALQAAKNEQIKTLLMFGVPAALIIVVLLMKKGK